MNTFIKRLAVFSAAAVCLLALAACGEAETETCESHTWDGGALTEEADCGNPGVMTYTCTVCGETKTEPYGEGTGEHSFSDGVCTVCGYVDMSGIGEEEAIETYGYWHDDADGSGTVNTGDYISFGAYPRDEVTDSAVLSALNALLDESAWTSYGYSVENEESDFMCWQDAEYDGETYRAVYATENRPYFTDLTSDYSFVSSNGYPAGTVYWFEYAPLSWRVLDYADGEALLNTADCIDSRSFADTYTKDGSDFLNADGSYSNDWAGSAIREWLNGDFYGTAFTAAQQTMIAEQTLDNSTTGYSTTNSYSAVQSDTEDSVYLLSYQDMLNERYGFPEVETGNVTGNGDGNLAVCKSGTDYALAQGIRTSSTTTNANGDPCSWWLLRSPGNKSFAVCGITKYGTITKANTLSYSAGQTSESDGIAFCTSEGISPAVTVRIGK